MKQSRPGEEIKRFEVQGVKLGFKLPDGTFKEYELPPLDDYDDEDVSWPEFSNEGVVVTPAGRDRADNLLAAAAKEFAVLGERVERLLELSYFDTAVREACVSLENQIKTWLESENWGDSLVEELIS